MKILIVNGPNLNLLGRREPELYGGMVFEDFLVELRTEFHRTEIGYYQSNIEGELIDALQRADGVYDGVVLNGGGYTHTSVSIRDAISAISIPVVEVHLTSLAGREEFRHTSFLTPVCKGSIMGFGLNTYRLGILSLLHEQETPHK